MAALDGDSRVFSWMFGMEWNTNFWSLLVDMKHKSESDKEPLSISVGVTKKDKVDLLFWSEIRLENDPDEDVTNACS